MLRYITYVRSCVTASVPHLSRFNVYKGKSDQRKWKEHDFNKIGYFEPIDTKVYIFVTEQMCCRASFGISYFAYKSSKF